MHTEDPFMEDFQQEEGKHLRDYLPILLNHKGLILTVLSITFLIGALSTYSKIPIYTASTKVLIEKNQDISSMEGFNRYMMWDPDFRATQFELIRSYNVAYRVVETLQLDTRYRQYFLEKKAASFSPVTFIKTFIKSLVRDLLAKVKGTSETGEIKDKDEGKDKEPEINKEKKTDADIIASIILGGIQVVPMKDTKIVRIKFSHDTPKIAKMVANAIVQAYIDETLDIKTSSARYSLKWMTAKADEERTKLEQSEKALQQYMRKHDIVTVENKLAIYPDRLAEFSGQFSAAQAKEKEFEAIHHQIERAGKDYTALERIPLFAGNSVLQNLRNQILTSEQHIRELSKKYGRKHPKIIKAHGERNLLRQEKKIEIDRIVGANQNGYELAKIKVRDLKQLMDATKEELLDMNERFVQYTILNRAKELNQSVFNALSTSIKKTNLTAQSQDVKIWVVRKAGLPGAPSKPNKKRELMMAAILGLCGGLGLSFFLEYLDNTAKSNQEIENRYNLTVLGAVEDLKGKDEAIETHIHDKPLSPVAESYRLIRSALLLSTPDHPPRTILITSMVQQEGKTSNTINLAYILAQNEHKVLIIDCDMRRPRQHTIFGIENSYGLSNYLSGNTDAKLELIRKEIQPLISVIPSGPVPPNPAELLISKKMGILLNEAQKKYDFVLLDSPPIQQVTDSLMLGPLVDGTIIVIKAGSTTFDMLDSGIKKLREGHTHILGVIFNRIKRKHAGKGYYGYYGYYSYYKKGYGGYSQESQGTTSKQNT